MTFWTDAKSAPMRNFRFTATFGSKLTAKSYALKKFTKPSFTVQETSHKWLNHTFYYPGRLEWNTVSFSMVDPGSSDSTASSLMDFLNSTGYVTPTTESAKTTQSKSSATLGEVKIMQLDADGATVETWTLKNPWIKDIKFGELDYENDDLTQIDVELRYDSATRTTNQS